ncbi:Uncharacterised protein [Burkholderia pseudomallei]|nr:Uncharacterised protein [Burkholderia pseudomallei]
MIARGLLDVRDEPAAVRRVLAVRERGGGDRRVAAQHAADFVELHAIAANLQLLVRPAVEVDDAGSIAMPEVARAVQPQRRAVDDDLDERARGAFVVVQIAPREARRRDADLADDAARHRLQMRVEHMKARVADGPADRHGVAGVRLGAVEAAGVDGHFGRAVMVREAAAERAREALGEAAIQRRRAADHLPQRREARDLAPLARVDERLEHRRHELGERHPLALDHVGQAVRALERIVAHHDDARAVRERPEHVLDEHVERERRVEQHAVVRVEAVGPLQVGEHADDAAMLDLDALRRAGRAGRVQDVGELPRIDARRIAVRIAAERAHHVVDAHDVVRERRERAPQAAMRERPARVRVAQDRVDAFLRVLRADRHERAAHLQDRVQRDDHLERRPQHHGDVLAARHAERQQVMREPVGLPVQRLVIVRDALHDERRGRGRAGRLLGHQRVHRRRLVVVDARAVQRGGRIAVRADHRVAGQRLVRIVEHLIHQRRHVLEHLLDRRRVEQIDVVNATEHDVAAELVDDEVQIESRRLVLGIDDVLEAEREAVELQPAHQIGLVVLHAVHDREQLRPRQVLLVLQLLDHLVRRIVIVLERLERALRHLREQLAERHVLADRAADRHRRREQAEQRLQALVGAPRDRAADHEIALTADAAQIAVEDRELQHEERHVMLLQVRLDLAHDAARQPGAQRVAAVRHQVRPRPVGRQVERRRQHAVHVEPVALVLVERAAAQLLVRPLHVVEIADFERRHVRRAARRMRVVQLAQLEHQVDQRRFVPDDVVHDEDQLMEVARVARHVQPEQRTVREIERRGAEPRAEPVRLVDRVGAGERRAIEEHVLGADVDRRIDDLDRRAVAIVELHAQHVVPLENRAPRGDERVAVQLAGEEQVGDADVVDGARRVHLVRVPLRHLARRELVMRARRQALDARGPGRVRRGAQRVQRRRDVAQLRRLEQRAQRQRDAEQRAHAQRQLGREQRMAAELEEAVERADLVDVEQLAPQLGEPRFGLRRGRDMLVAAEDVLIRRLRQALAVDLAVRVQRELVHQHERRGHHVARDAAGHERAQLGHGRRRMAMRDHVAEQIQAVLAVARGDHHRLTHVVVIADRLFDFADLDPLAADLHLEILAAEEFEGAVRPVAREVARLVQAAARPRRERVRHERARGARRIAQIAAPDADAADVDLARHADRHRLEALVEQVGRQVRQRALDRHIRQRARQRLADPQVARIVRALGRAVRVDHGNVRRAREPARAQRGRQRFGVAHVHAYPAEPVPPRPRLEFVDQDLHVRRHRFEHGHAVGVELREQLLRIPRRVARHHRRAAAHEQRDEVLPDRHVEGGHRHLGDDVVLADRQVVDLREQVVQHAALLDHRALRQPGRARRVDHVRERRRRERQELGRRRGLARQRVEREARRARGERLRAPGARRVVHDVAHVAQFGDPVELVRGIVGVHRRECHARLQHAEHRDQVVEIAPDQQPDEILAARAGREQIARDAIGRAVELAVGQRRLAAARRHARRMQRRLPGEQIAHVDAVGQRPRRLVQRAHLVRAFVVAEERQRVERAVRTRGDAREQVPVVIGHAPDRRGFEEIGAELEAAVQPSVVRPRRQIQVELRAPVLGLDARRDEAVERGRLERIGLLVREHRLEQPGAVTLAPRVHVGRDLFERDILVIERVEAGRAHVLQQAREGRRRIRPHADHQRVDEEADDRLELGPRAAERGHADQQIVLPRVAREERRVRGEQQHEHRYVMPLRHRLQPRGERVVERERERLAAAARLRRALEVGRQLQHRQRAVELRAPVVELAFALAAVEHAPVPRGEVAVLERARGRVGGRLRRPAAARRVVMAREAALEQADRPAVDDNVMEHRQQQVLVRRKRDERERRERAARQVERRVERAAHERVECRVARIGRERGQVVPVEPGLRPRGDHLQRRLAFDDERRAQRFMLVERMRERRAQRGGVERPGKLQQVRQVVRGAVRIALMQIPEPVLRAGQRRRARVDRLDRRPGLVGRGGVAARAQPLDEHRERAHRRAVEQRGDGQPHRIHRLDAAIDADREQRAAAEAEEVVVDAERVVSEQFAPEREQRRFGRRQRGRGHDRIVGREQQRAAVDLLVRRQRKRVHHDDLGRHHVRGQPCAQVIDERRAVGAGGRARARRRFFEDHVADQRIARMSRLAREHDCLRDVRMRFEHRLNLLGLDADAVHLHLEVGAAEIMEAPLEVVAHPIAGPIQARAGGGGERIGDETLRGQRRPPMVAVRDADAADVELARHVGGHRIQACVEHVQMRVRDRPVQIDFAVLERARDVDPVDDAADRAFARPVDVVERDAPRRRAMPLANRLERDLFAADADEPHRAEPGRAAVGRQMLAQHAPVRGGQREDADPLRTAGVDERRHRALDVLVADVQRSARAQRREDLLERRVERERREQHRAIAARIAEAFDDRADVVDDAAMMEHRRLRRARRTRRVGEEHAVIGRRLGGRRGCVARVPRRAVEREPLAVEASERRARRCEHVAAAAVGDHRVEPLRRQPGVDRQADRPRLDRRDDAEHRVDTVRGLDAHHHARANALFPQDGGERIGAARERREAQRSRRRHERRVRRGGRRPVVDEPVQQRRAVRAARLCEHAAVVDARRVAQPLDDRLLVRGQEREAPDGLIGVGRHAVEQRAEVLEPALDGRRVEALGRVDARQREPLRRFAQRDRQIRDRRLRRAVEQLGAQAVAVGRARVVRERLRVEVEHRLEQAARRVRALFGDPVERQCVVPVHAAQIVAHLPQQRRVGQMRPHARAHRQHVDEEPDEVFQLRAPAVVVRHPDDEIALPAQPVQPREVRGDQHLVQRRLLAARERLQPRERIGRPRDRQPAAVARCGAGAVMRDGQRRMRGQRVQIVAPERAQRVFRAGQLALRPDAVIPVLDRQRREPRRALRALRRVAFEQIAQEHVRGPRVDDDVMEACREHAAVRRRLDQHELEERPGREVERLDGQPREVVAHEIVLHRRRVARQVHLQQVRFARVGARRALARAVFRVDDARAQDLVPLDRRRHGRAQPRGIERAAHAQRADDVVVDAAAIERLHEPETLLRRRQRNRRAGRRDGNAGMGARRVERARERREIVGREKVLQRDLARHARLDQRDGPRGQQRMPAEREEVRVRVVDGLAEQRAPDGRERALGFRAQRRSPRIGVGRARRGQRRIIDLAVARQRQRVELDDVRRHHERRQLRGDRAFQARRAIRRAGAVRRIEHDVGDELRPGLRMVERGHRRVVHAGVRFDGVQDFARLDPMAANLHLVVRAADVVELARVVPADEIAGAVHACIGHARERIGDEPRVRQRVVRPVAAHQRRAADVQLARYAARGELAVPVEHVDAHVVERRADRRRLAGALRDFARGRDDTVLRRPVVIEQPVARAGGRAAREPLAAREQIREARRAEPAVREHGVRERRRGEAMRDAPRAQPLFEMAGRLARRVRCEPDARARAQIRPDLPNGGVEADARRLARANRLRRVVQPVRARMPCAQVREAPVRDLDALRRAGRAGRIDDVREIVRRGFDVEIAVRQRRGLRRERVPPDGRDGVRRLRGRRVRLRDDEPRAAVRDDAQLARVRIARVDRHVRGAQLQHRERGERERRAGPHAERHRVARRDAERAQPAREPVRGCVEHRVADARAVFARERERLRIGVRDPFDLPMHRRAGPRRGRPAAEPQQRVGLRGVDEPRARGRQLRRLQHLFEDAPVGVEQTARPLDAQRGAAEVQRDSHAPERVGAATQRQIEFRAAVGTALDAQPRVAERARRRPGLLEIEHRLHELARAVAAVAARELHHPLVADVRVPERGDARVAPAAHLLLERVRVAERDANRQHVDEHADHVRRVRQIAARVRDADQHVGVAAEFRDEQPVGRQIHRRFGHAPARRHGPNVPREIGRQRVADFVAARRAGRVLRRGGAGRTQRGEARRPRARKLRSPERQRRGLALARGLGAAPHAVVRVMRGLRRAGRIRAGACLAQVRIARGDIVEQDRDRASVRDDVMKIQQQIAVVGGERQIGRLEERAGLEIEALRFPCVDPRLHGRVVRRRRGAIGVDVDRQPFHGDGSRRQDDLARLAVLPREAGAQRLVARDGLRERGREPLEIERAVHPERAANVVIGAVRLERLQQPHPLLRGAERHARGPPGAREPNGRRDGRGGRAAQVRGERRDLRMREQVGDRHRDAEPRANARRDARDQQRMPAEREEIVVGAHRAAAERFLINVRDRLLERIGEGGFVRGRERRGRQRAPADLAVRVERQRIGDHESGGPHVRRQPAVDERAQCRLGQARVARDVRGEQLARRFALERDHLALRDARMRGEHRLDLARLDPEAADLHLVVRAADEMQPSVFVEPHEVAGRIQARAGRRHVGRVRVGGRHEALGRQRGPIQIAEREPRAAHVQLAAHAERRRPQLRVEDVQRLAANRRADVRQRRKARGPGGALRGFGRRLDRAARRDHRVFGRAVCVDQLEPVARAAARLQLIAARQQEAQRARPRGRRDERLREGRRHEAVADRVRVEPARELGHIVPRIRRRFREARARAQRGPDFPDGRVEAGPGEHRRARARVERECVDVPVDEIREAAVRDEHALRLAGRAARVDAIRGLARGDRNARQRAAGMPCGCRVVERVRADDVRAGRGQARPVVARGQHELRAAIVEQIREPLGRIREVHGHVGRADLEDRERDARLHCALADGERDPVARRDAVLDEHVAERVGGARQLAVRERAAGGGQRERVRLPGGRAAEPIDDAVAVRAGRRRVRARPMRQAAAQQRMFRGRHVRHVAEPRARAMRERLQHATVVRGEPLDHRGRVAIGAVADRRGEFAAVVDQGERDVERRAIVPRFARRQRRVAEREPAARLAEHERRQPVAGIRAGLHRARGARREQRDHRLHERAVRRAPLGRERLGQHGQRQRLMQQAADDRALDVVQPVGERSAIVERNPDRQHVREIADRIRVGRAWAAVRGHPDDHVALAGVAAEQQRAGREQHVIGGEDVPPRERAHGAHRPRVDRETVGARAGRGRRDRRRRKRGARGHPAQLLAPIRGVPRRLRRVQPAVLPRGEFAVAAGRAERCVGAARERVVELLQFGDQDVERPHVDDRMVQRQRDVSRIRSFCEHRAPRRAAQVERRGERVARRLQRGRVVRAAKRRLLERVRVARDRAAVDFGEPHAQRIAARGEARQREHEQLGVERAVDGGDEALVVIVRFACGLLDQP